jgi:PAS domain S-box-containing protein
MYYVSLVDQSAVGSLAPVALIHTLGAFLLLGFVIGHVYLTTTGHRPLSAIKAMLTGWEDMSDEDAEMALEENLKVALIESRKGISGRGSIEKEGMFETAFEDVVEKLGISTESTRLREKLLSSNVGYFRIGKDGKYQEVNEVWLKLYKCTNKKEVIGSDVTLDRTPEGKKQIMTLVNKILSGEIITGERVERVCKDGSIGYHTVSAAPLKDKDGNIVGLEGFIIDITPQVEAEKALEKKIAAQHRSNIFYEQIAKSKDVGYFRIGDQGFYQEVNDAWLKLYKYESKDEIIGKHYSLSRTKEDFIKLKQSFEKVLKGETIPLGITRRYCKDGSVGYHTITMTPVYENGKITAVEGFIVDKTDRKLAEEELKKGQV